MSDLTRCNYCTLQRMQEAAQRDGDTLRTEFERPDRQTLERWTLVYRNDEVEPVAILRVLTAHCAC